MSDSAGQAADCFHLLSLDKLFLKAPGAILFFVALLLCQFAVCNFGLQRLIRMQKLGGALAHANFKKIPGIRQFLL